MSARRSAFPERGLLGAVRLGIGLVLLTPLAFSMATLYPFTVGKGLYARTAIAATLVLWAVLALWCPAWRPPRARLLLVFALGVAVAALAGAAGVSPQASLWGNYVRMQGLVDLAHWLAFAVVLVAVLRTDADWRRMLNVNVAVGLVAAAAAILAYAFPELIRDGGVADPRFRRAGGTLGNPNYLGIYMQAVALLAMGLLARSFAPEPPAPETPAGRRKRPRAAPPGRPPATAALRAFWVAAIAASVWALGLSGSVGAALGFGAGIAAAAALLALRGSPPALRRAAGGVLALSAALVLAAGALFAWRWAESPPEPGRPPPPAARVFDNVLLERATNPWTAMISVRQRLVNWEAGLLAAVDRPLLGWGPENYLSAAGRHAESRGNRNPGRDRAHNMLVEEAATKGLVGLAAYLALWALTAVAVVRAARRAPLGDRLLIAFAGGALAGWFVQSQTMFYSASSWMQHLLLLGFAAHLELAARRPAPSAWLRGVLAPLSTRAGRVAAAAGAAALCAGSFVSSASIHEATAALLRAEHKGPFMRELHGSMRAFEPMATHAQILLVENVAANWDVLRKRSRHESFRLLGWAEREAEAALASEPRNWQLRHAVARLYAAVAADRPGVPDGSAPPPRACPRTHPGSRPDAAVGAAVSGAPRYLRYVEREPRPAGLEHQLRNLRWLLAEAHLSGRLAVRPPLRLDPRHNFGVDRAWCWETYVDLAASRLLDGGHGYALPLAERPPARPRSTLTLPPGAPLPAACDAQLVVRHLASNLYLRDVALPGRRRPARLRGVVPVRTPVAFRLHASLRVRTLAAPVLEALRARAPTWAAVHVRRGDRMVGPARRAVAPARVAAVLRAHGVPDGAVLFLLTDERDPAFLAALAARYDVVRATDFAGPAALVSSAAECAPDNYLLYAVEREVMRHAAVRIETLPTPTDEPPDATLVPAWRWRAYAALRWVRGAVGGRAWTALAAAAGRG